MKTTLKVTEIPLLQVGDVIVCGGQRFTVVMIDRGSKEFPVHLHDGSWPSRNVTLALLAAGEVEREGPIVFDAVVYSERGRKHIATADGVYDFPGIQHLADGTLVTATLDVKEKKR